MFSSEKAFQVVIILFHKNEKLAEIFCLASLKNFA